jgi:hypothetical protein|tara:strand:- start:652 stop:927 length:276 start_codon:yes stop_codon:yes gene_type:complete
MDEYILTVVDDEEEVSTLKSFAETIEELVDNIVCMEHIKSITHVLRVKDQATWNITDDTSLEILREYRKGITDNVGLRNYLTGREELDEKG